MCRIVFKIESRPQMVKEANGGQVGDVLAQNRDLGDARLALQDDRHQRASNWLRRSSNPRGLARLVLDGHRSQAHRGQRLGPVLVGRSTNELLRGAAVNQGLVGPGGEEDWAYGFRQPC